MGTWGTGIYQSDTAADVKDEYMNQLRAGKSDEEALAGVMKFYGPDLDDEDERYDVAFALADTMWKKGRLTEEIRELALGLIEEEPKSGRWEGEKLRKQRQGQLTKLKNELCSPMPERKRIPIHKPYRTGWEEGDMYAFPLNPVEWKGTEYEEYEEYEGWYGVIYVDRIALRDKKVRGVYDEVPEVYAFVAPCKPQGAEEWKSWTPVIVWPLHIAYRAVLVESSKRERRKELEFIGKCTTFEPPAQEWVKMGILTWSLLDNYLLLGYRGYLRSVQNRWEEGGIRAILYREIQYKYEQKLLAGKSGEEAVEELLPRYCWATDQERYVYDIYFGLFDYMWESGHIVEQVREKSLELLRRGSGDSYRQEQIRDIERKLAAPLPPEKEIQPLEAHICGFRETEVYTFRLSGLSEYFSGYNGWHALMYVNRIARKDWRVSEVYDEVPEVYFFLCKKKPAAASDIRTATPTCFYIDEGESMYHANLMETSVSERPHDLELLGEFDGFTLPKNQMGLRAYIQWEKAAWSVAYGADKHYTEKLYDFNA